jgi:hypothetical protein
VKAESRLEGGSGGGASVERQGHFPTSNLSVADIAETFNATIVDSSESLAEQAAFVRRHNAQQPEPSNIPIEPRYVGKKYIRHRHTSRAAAMQADRMGAMRTRVLETLKAIGPACDDRVAHELGLDSSSIRPRRIELERTGLIRENGKERTRSGRWAIRWEAL